MSQTTPEPEVVASATPASTTRSLLALHVGIAITVGLYFAREVLIPIALAVLLSFVLSPLVDRLRAWRLWRVPSVLISVVVAIGIMLAIGGVIGTQIAQLARNVPQYSGTIEQKITSAQTYVTDRLATVTARLGLGASREGATSTGPAAQPGTPAGQRQTKPEQASTTSPVSIAEKYLFPILSPVATAGIRARRGDLSAASERRPARPAHPPVRLGRSTCIGPQSRWTMQRRGSAVIC